MNPNAIPESEYPVRTLDAIKEFALKKMAEHNLISQGWKFVYNARTVRRLGQCSWVKKEIELNVDHAKTSIMEQVVDTIMHEIAHALCSRGSGHGKEWKRMAYSVGADPSAKKKVVKSPEYMAANADKKVPVFMMKTGDGVERYASTMSIALYKKILSGKSNIKNIYMNKNKALTEGRLYVKVLSLSEIETYPKLAL